MTNEFNVNNLPEDGTVFGIDVVDVVEEANATDVNANKVEGDVSTAKDTTHEDASFVKDGETEVINIDLNDPDALKVHVTQIGKGISCADAFKVLQALRDVERDKPYEERTAKSKIFNRFSGEYFSPTFVESFTGCPARSFINALLPRKVNEVTNFGSCAHKVFERIVVEGIQSNVDACEDIAREELENYSVSSPSYVKTLINVYLPNFLQARDYLNPSEPMPWNEVSSFPETFYKSNLDPFGVSLGSCFTLMDRIDIREDGIYVFDYKTGRAPADTQKMADFIARYTNQMIVYAWQIEKQYGIKPKGVYAYLPDNNTYVRFPVESLKLQSMMVEEVLKYYEDIKVQRSEAYFQQKVNAYCKYCPIKEICNAYNEKDDTVTIPFNLGELG